MSIKINYGYETVTIPAAAMTVLERAQASDIRLLMALCTDSRLRGKSENDYTAFAQAAGITEAQAVASLAFWRGAGILVTDRTAADAPAAAPAPAAASPAVSAAVPAVPEAVTAPAGNDAPPAEAKPAQPAKEEQRPAKPTPHDQLPIYTTDQIAAILEQNPETAAFINEAQTVWGKMFVVPREINIILGLVEYLGLEWDYVLILLAYCRKLLERRGHKLTLHYVETAAFSFYDEGVCDTDALQEHIRRQELMADTEGRLRTMFGMNSRALTPTEKRLFSTWLYDYGYDIDIIRRAFDITVDAIREPKPKYMNTILAGWHSEGLKTLAEIDKYEADKPRGGSKSKPDADRRMASSFETDDFFEAAVRRSFGTVPDPDDKA